MKAMILAAGLGTRLRPFTKFLPKALMPIGNKPLLDYHLDTLEKLGVHEVIINVHHHATAIGKHLAKSSRVGIRVTLSYEEDLLGTGGALAKVRSFFEGERQFLVVNSDLWHIFDLRSALAWSSSSDAPATLIVQPLENKHDIPGALNTDKNGWITRVPDMRINARARHWKFTGLHIMTPVVLDALTNEMRGCIVRVGYRKMIEKGKPPNIYFPPFSPWWDVGTPEGLLAANLHHLADGKSLIAPDANIEPGAILGPQVIIGSGSTVSRGAHLSRTVVLGGSHVPEGTWLDRSIVSPQYTVTMRKVR